MKANNKIAKKNKPAEAARHPTGTEAAAPRFNQAETLEPLFHAFLESSYDGIIIVNQTGNITLVNARAEKIFGYPREELIGRSHDILVPDRFKKTHDQELTRYFSQPAGRAMGIGLELVGRRKDGSEFAADISLNPLKTKDGLLVTAFVRDITERKQAEAALLREKQSLEIVTRFTNSALFLLDNQTRVTYANNVAQEWFGPMSDIGGKFCWQVFQLKDPGRECAGLEVMRTGEAVRRETLAKLSGKKSKYVLLDATPIKDTGGNIEQILEVATDITRLKNAEKLVRDSEERLRQITENMEELVYLVDPKDHKLLYINPAYEKMWGRSLESAYENPLSWMDSLHPEDRQSVSALMEKHGPQTAPIEARVIKPDGSTRWVKNHVIPIRDESGQVYRIIGVITDITDHKHHEAEIRGKREQLVEQNKIASSFLSILEISSSSLNFAESLVKLLPVVNQLAGGNYCLTYFVDENEETLIKPNQWGLSKEGLSYFLSLGPSFSKPELPIAFQQENRYIENIDEVMPQLAQKLQEFFRRLNLKSLQIMPLVCDRKPVAIFLSLYTNEKQFSKKDKEIAQKIRQHLEASFLADKNAAMLLSESMKLAQQLEMTEAMSGIDSAILRSTTKEEVIFGAINLFSQVVAGDVIEILDYKTEDKLFRLAAVYENGSTSGNLSESFYRDDIQSWSSIVFGVPVYYPNFDKEAAEGPFEKRFMAGGYKSLMVIPLQSKGDLIGIIAIGNKRTAPYAPPTLGVIQRLANQIAVALSNTDLIDQLKELLVGVVNSMAAALDAKSPWTKGHSQRVGNVAMDIGKALALNDDDLYKLRLAALFHDIGKIGTYDVVLDKTDKLTDDEMAMIKKHPQKTYDILEPIPRLREIGVIAKHHHERWNGQGYPDGLAGDDIPFLSRVLTVADTFDAMTTDRPYRKGLSVDQAINEISSLAGVQFDKEIAAVFIDMLKSAVKAKKSPGKRRKAA